MGGGVWGGGLVSRVPTKEGPLIVVAKKPYGRLRHATDDELHRAIVAWMTATDCGLRELAVLEMRANLATAELAARELGTHYSARQYFDRWGRPANS